MLGFNSLYSSSSGNSFLIQTNDTKILIDVGVSERKISNALSFLNIDTSEISAVLITHEHSDHIAGLNTLYKKYKIPVYISKKTSKNISNFKIDDEDVINFEPETAFTINDLEVLPFRTSHDAAESCGFCICHDRKKITIATDLGYVSNNVYEHLQNSDFVLLESNYEPNLLEYNTKYPWYLKQRILGASRTFI